MASIYVGRASTTEFIPAFLQLATEDCKPTYCKMAKINFVGASMAWLVYCWQYGMASMALLVKCWQYDKASTILAAVYC